ncbi:MAG: hypothetical protein SGPRY_000023, partial [Prymnesium sp.]
MVAHSARLSWTDLLLDGCPEAVDLKCPISNVLMFDPVIAEDGFTYERSAIELWLKTQQKSAMVRDRNGFIPMGPKLTPNAERKAALDRLLHEYAESDEEEVVTWVRSLKRILTSFATVRIHNT